MEHVFLINYWAISPVILINLIEKSVPNACCIFRDLGEDAFELTVCPWYNARLTVADIVRVEKLLAPYV